MKVRHVADMEELDPIRELVVEAMAELEQALVDGLPAQAPGSGRLDIEEGMIALRTRITRACLKIDIAKMLLEKM